MTPAQQQQLDDQDAAAQAPTATQRMLSRCILQRNEQMDRLLQCEATVEELDFGMKRAEAVIVQLTAQVETMTGDKQRYETANETNNALLAAAKSQSADLQSKLDAALARVQELEAAAQSPATGFAPVKTASALDPLPLSTTE